MMRPDSFFSDMAPLFPRTGYQRTGAASGNGTRRWHRSIDDLGTQTGEDVHQLLAEFLFTCDWCPIVKLVMRAHTESECGVESTCQLLVVRLGVRVRIVPWNDDATI